MPGTYSVPGKALKKQLEPKLDKYLDELHQFCAIDTKSGFAEGIDATVELVKSLVADRNWAIREWPDADAGAGIEVAATGGNPNGARIMLVVHHDTVHPVGSAESWKPARNGDNLIGPGVIDVKSGLLSSLYAIGALEYLDLLGDIAKISLVSTPDEEADMRVSKVMLEELAPEYDVALSVEAANPDGSIVTSRKGGSTYTLKVQGQPAHASRPHDGANAIHALAMQVVAIQGLQAFRPEVTVNVGIIEGGTADNTVPEHARAVIDVRMTGHDGDTDAIDAAMESIGGNPYVHGTTSTITRDLYFPPMPQTPKITALADLAVECAADLGIDVVYGPRGGITLANLLAGHGLPTLDGLGPVGGGEHSQDEYLVVPSIVPRIEMLALFCYAISKDFQRES